MKEISILSEGLVGDQNSKPAYRVQAESNVLSRSEVAATKRNLTELGKSLDLIQRQLISTPVDQTNAQEVAEKLLAASALRESLKRHEQQIVSSLPQTKGGKLSDRERQEIAGYYATGHFTQDALAEQYGVSQSTIHEVVAPKRDDS
jgi:DNA-directed RNA polymerase specialized sigma subunit